MKLLRTLLCGLLLASCAEGTEPSLDFPLDESAGGKTDVFGRRLAGVAAPFMPNPTLSAREDELRTDMRARREAAWATAHHVLEPVPLLGLACDPEADVEVDGEANPEVPRWQTWYGIDDLRRILHGPRGCTIVHN